MAQAAKLSKEDTRSSASFSLPGPVSKIAEYPKRLKQFVHDVRVEMRQVTWPSWFEVRSTTVVVTVTVAFFGLFFAITDFLLGRASSWLLHYFK